MVAEFQSKNCIRPLRHGRTRSDSDCATTNKGCGVNISRADFFRHRQNNRDVRASTFKIGSSNRIAIARSQISNREVERSLDIFCQDATNSIWKLNIQRGLLSDSGNTVLIEVSDRAHYRPSTFARRSLICDPASWTRKSASCGPSFGSSRAKAMLASR